MKINTIDLSINNVQLAPIRSTLYGRGSIPIPNARMGDLYDPLAAIFHYVTGREMDPTGNTLLVIADMDDRGRFKSLYAPKAYLDGDNLVIRWGGDQINVTLPGLISESGNQLKLVDNVYKRPSLRCQIVKDGELVVLDVPLHTVSGYDDCSASTLNVLLEHDVEDFKKHITPLKKTGAFEELPITDMKQLEVGKTYNVVSTRQVQTKNGPTNILRIENEDEPVFECWSNSKLNPTVWSSVVNPSKPAKLTVERHYQTKNGKTGVDFTWLASEHRSSINIADL